MDSSTLRARARGNLAGNWGLSIGVAVVAALLGGLLAGGSFLPEPSVELPIHFPALDESIVKLNAWLTQGLTIGNFTFSFRSGIFGFAAFILGGTLQLGYAQFLLKQHDGERIDFKDLFSQFDRFGTGFLQRFLRSIYVTLWSLLFVIPGIVKSFSYAMTPFILADHPNMNASEAIDRSKELMDGQKMDLFILDLTFFGWVFLAAITANLGFILLNPYQNAAHAAFYRQLLAENRYTNCQ